MKRETAKRLEDARVACVELMGFAHGRTEEDLFTDRAFQLVVERLLITIGEAINLTLQSDDDGEDLEIPSARGIVGMRNRIVHGYDKVRLEVVWDAVVNKVPELNQHLDTLLYGVKD